MYVLSVLPCCPVGSRYVCRPSSDTVRPARQGVVAVGSDADLVVWDGEASRVISAQTHHQRCDFNVFEGMRVRGVAEYVLSRGRVCVDQGRVQAVRAAGRFVPTPAYSPEVYLRVQQRDRTRTPRPVDRSEPTEGGVPTAETDQQQPATTDSGPAGAQHQGTYSRTAAGTTTPTSVGAASQ